MKAKMDQVFGSIFYGLYLYYVLDLALVLVIIIKEEKIKETLLCFSKNLEIMTRTLVLEDYYQVMEVKTLYLQIKINKDFINLLCEGRYINICCKFIFVK